MLTLHLPVFDGPGPDFQAPLLDESNRYKRYAFRGYVVDTSCTPSGAYKADLWRPSLPRKGRGRLVKVIPACSHVDALVKARAFINCLLKTR